VKRLLNE
jgi:hypothetical protein